MHKSKDKIGTHIYGQYRFYNFKLLIDLLLLFVVVVIVLLLQMGAYFMLLFSFHYTLLK